jgi:hypothetical protein
MSDLPPRIVLEPHPGELARTAVHWDAESSVLSIALAHATNSDRSEPLTLSRQLDLARGIEPVERRLVLGALEIALDPQERILLLEIRTNPRGWLTETLLPLTDPRERLAVHFMVDFDEHGIATLEVPLCIQCNRSRRELVFGFGSYRSSRWADVANGLVIGVTQDSYLSELRLLDMDLPA